MNLFLDFDGTLLDSRKRLYHLFSFLVPTSKLSFTDYWKLKRAGIGHKEILQKQFSYQEDALADFQQQWHKLIEEPEWIKYDTAFPGVTEKLVELKEKYALCLVTARQYHTVVQQQLTELNWINLFKYVLVTAQQTEKQILIAQNVAVTSADWIIGDTGKDVQTGKLLNIKTAAVLSGFLSKEKLMKYQPDIVLDSITNFNL